MKKRSSESPLRRVSGPSAASTQPLRGLVALGCFLSAVLVAAVVSAGAFDAPRQPAHRPLADSAFESAEAARRFHAVFKEIDRMRDTSLGGMVCEEEGEWFPWQRLRRNFPFIGAEDDDAQSQYGISVDISGNVAVVGAHRQRVFVDPDDISAGDEDKPIEVANAGTVYIFRLVGGEWVRVATIEPPLDSMFLDGAPMTAPRFGRSVAVASSPDEDVVVIGAPQESVLFFDKNDGVIGGIPFAGAAHIYRRTGPTWPTVQDEQWERQTNVVNLEYFCLFDEQPCTLDTPDLVVSANKLQNDFFLDDVELFGLRVDILPFRETDEGWVGGDIVAVGSPNAWGFPHCGNLENPGPRSGTVTMFRRGGTTPDGLEWPDNWWVNEQALTYMCDLAEGFGASVDLQHSFERDLPVLAAGADLGRAEIFDPKNPDEPIVIGGAGAVVLSEYDFPEDDKNDENGRLAFSMILGDDDDDDDEPRERWNFVDQLQSPTPRTGEFFGRSVAVLTSPITNDAVVVGAPFAHAIVDDKDEDQPAGGTDGSEGAAYVFRHTKLSGAMTGDPTDDEFEWIMERKLISLLFQNFGEFGTSIAGAGNTIVVGAPREGDFLDPGDPDEFFEAIGFAYAFVHDGSDWDMGTIVLPFGPETMEPFDQFGTDVAIDGNFMLAGAPGSNWPSVDDEGEEIILPSVGSAFAYGRCFEAEGKNDCFQASPDPGCDSPACVNAVCAFDASCCEVEWGPQCVALAMTLPGPCGFPIENCPGVANCCAVDIDNPGCNDPDCCAAVCALDSFCCDVNWDACCVVLAEDVCDVCPPTPDPSCEGFCGAGNVDGCGTCSCAPDCDVLGNCCEDVCEHCDDGGAGFKWCPDDLAAGDGPPARTSPVIGSAPR